MSHLVSPSFANFPGCGAVVWCLCFLVVFLFGCFACYQGISAVISFLSIKIQVVDRQCLVLDRQCREKKKILLLRSIRCFAIEISLVPNNSQAKELP